MKQIYIRRQRLTWLACGENTKKENAENDHESKTHRQKKEEEIKKKRWFDSKQENLRSMENFKLERKAAIG